MEAIFSILEAFFKSLLSNPASALVILPISILAWYLEIAKWFSSKYIFAICLVLGAILLPLLVKPSTVPPEFPNPKFVLGIDGFCMGFIAAIIHVALITRIIAYFQGKTDNPNPPSQP